MSEETEFKVGDVVYLKSGSQRMTIEFIDGPHFVRVICMPYGSHVLIKESIAKEALVKKQ